MSPKLCSNERTNLFDVEVQSKAIFDLIVALEAQLNPVIPV
jgi:hypothetical protein